MQGARAFVLGVILVAQAIAEVTILKSVTYLYDRSPKLRIRGDGFENVDEHDVILEIGATGQAALRMDKDYLLSKDPDGDGIILKLLSSRKWANLDGRTPPVALILSKVAFKSAADKNLLPMGEPIIVAQVLETPSVVESADIIYTTATNELQINGTGFVGAKDVSFYFDPPLYKEVGYEVVTKFPTTNSFIKLRLRHGYKWREEPGPLSIIGVDTGGGPVKLNGEDGVRVAEVQADLDLHGVKVETTADKQVIYHDQSEIVIKGEGFNPLGNTLRWANGLLGKGINYTTVETTEASIKLRLNSPGSHWRKNVESLPGFLTLLAVNAGVGFVAVGPTNAAKGRDVATVFEHPQIFSSQTKLYRTHSHELHIKGAGFPKILAKPKVTFVPALVENEDYKINVLDRSELEITLLDGKAWRPDTGPLIVSSINTGAGEVVLPGDGVHVAEVIADLESDATGGVEVYPMGPKVYQSALQEEITMSGNGFKSGISFTFDPDLKEGLDYDLSIESKNKATLRLKSTRKWRQDGAGFIIAKTVSVGGKAFKLAGDDGIRVAVVLADPSITAGDAKFHETQSKVISIQGTGFTNVVDTKVIIRPTAPSAYKVLAVLENTIRVQLKPGNDWLPDFLSLKDEDENKKIPLQVTGIDTGAGEVVFDNPIQVGFIVKDRVGVTCDDSCEFAFDGICDDGTQSEFYHYYEEYGYYQDDDLGGFYHSSYAAYDDYYMADDGYRVSACVRGTDCTDCGGVDAIVDFTKAPEPDSGVVSCDNTCPYARDGVCDDPRGANYCKLGTDCQDCGPVGSDNFTRADDDGWWDDDDDYWTFNDGNFLDQTKGLEANRGRVRVFNKQDNTGPAAMFLVVLEGMVYTVGAIFAAAALYLIVRWYRGAPVPFVNAFNPDSTAASEFELAKTKPMKVMPLTPDVYRS